MSHERKGCVTVALAVLVELGGGLVAKLNGLVEGNAFTSQRYRYKQRASCIDDIRAIDAQIARLPCVLCSNMREQ